MPTLTNDRGTERQITELTGVAPGVVTLDINELGDRRQEAQRAEALVAAIHQQTGADRNPGFWQRRRERKMERALAKVTFAKGISMEDPGEKVLEAEKRLHEQLAASIHSNTHLNRRLLGGIEEAARTGAMPQGDRLNFDTICEIFDNAVYSQVDSSHLQLETDPPRFARIEITFKDQAACDEFNELCQDLLGGKQTSTPPKFYQRNFTRDGQEFYKVEIDNFTYEDLCKLGRAQAALLREQYGNELGDNINMVVGHTYEQILESGIQLPEGLALRLKLNHEKFLELHPEGGNTVATSSGLTAAMGKKAKRFMKIEDEQGAVIDIERAMHTQEKNPSERSAIERNINYPTARISASGAAVSSSDFGSELRTGIVNSVTTEGTYADMRGNPKATIGVIASTGGLNIPGLLAEYVVRPVVATLTALERFPKAVPDLVHHWGLKRRQETARQSLQADSTRAATAGANAQEPAEIETVASPAPTSGLPTLRPSTPPRGNTTARR